MAKCVMCGKFAGIGRTQHDDCKRPVAWTHEEQVLMELRPVISSGVFRGMMAAFFVILGITVCCAFLYFIATTAAR